MNRTANQRWKDSGSKLSFKDFLNRERAKMASITSGGTEIIVNKPLNDAIAVSLAGIQNDLNVKTKLSNNTVFGINKYIIYASGLIIGGTILYKAYRHYKKIRL